MILSLGFTFSFMAVQQGTSAETKRRPNVLFVISDDQSKSFLVENRDDMKHRLYFLHAVGKRPAEELFDIRADPGCLNNLAGDPQHEKTRTELAERLRTHLEQTGDPRVVGPDFEVFESYRRYGGIRRYPAPDQEPDGWGDIKVP